MHCAFELSGGASSVWIWVCAVSSGDSAACTFFGGIRFHCLPLSLVSMVSDVAINLPLASTVATPASARTRTHTQARYSYPRVCVCVCGWMGLRFHATTPEITVGSMVTISGLKAKPELNGARGKVTSRSENRERWTVELGLGLGRVQLSLKQESLTVVS